MKRLVFCTGSRAEYGALRPFLRLARQSAVFEMQIVVSGMHLVIEHGYTLGEILADGFRQSAEVPMRADPIAGLQDGLAGFARAFWRLQPDMVLVEGDRVEALAAALAAGYMGIPLAHGCGGDVTTTIDNSARHAISHFAGLHFVSTPQAKARLEAMGVAGEIVVTGAPAIDAIMAMEWRSREETLADLGLPPGSRYLLVSFHPEPEHADQAGQWMGNVLRACRAAGPAVVVTYPNSDPGSDAIIREIEAFASAPPAGSPPTVLRAFPSLGSDRYLHAMRYAEALVGNSSSGLYEAPSLKVPVINVGRRQEGRIFARNIWTSRHDVASIRHALDQVLAPDFRRRLGDFANPYGDGKAAERMLAAIERRLSE